MVSPGDAGQRLCALVHLDAGHRAGRLDQLDQRRAVLGLLADGLVIQDDAGDMVLHRLVGAEQEFAIVAAVLFGVLHADGVEALLDGAGGFIGGQQALARAPPSSWRSRSVRRDSLSYLLSYLCRERFNARQFLAFKPFQKCPTGGRDIGEILLPRRHGRAPPPCRRRPPPTTAGPRLVAARDRLCRRHGSPVEGLGFKGAQRAVPDQGLGGRQPVLEGGNGSWGPHPAPSRRAPISATGTVRWGASRLEFPGHHHIGWAAGSRAPLSVAMCITLRAVSR